MLKFLKAHYEMRTKQRTLFLESFKRRIHERAFWRKNLHFKAPFNKTDPKVKGCLWETIWKRDKKSEEIVKKKEEMRKERNRKERSRKQRGK